MEELLSLKWNNHKNSFLHQMSLLRKKSTYTDVTLACDGELYNVHKMVLSACSDYFSNIFEKISCPNPIIILKDMSPTNLESLLDYMYLGEVSVRQAELASLIQSAECLKLKGLAVPDAEPESMSKKRSYHSSPIGRKKSKRPTSKDNTQHVSESIMQDDPPSEVHPTNSPLTLIKEDNSDDVSIKEENVELAEYASVWDINQENSNNFDNPPPNSTLDASQYEDPHSSFSQDVYQDDPPITEESNYDDQPPIASSSQILGNKTITADNLGTRYQCLYCSKVFYGKAHLQRHVRVHTGEKPYACTMCSHTCSRKDNLVSHVALKHHHKYN